MNRKHPTIDPTVDALPQLTVVLDRFESAWAAGSPPTIDQYVNDVADPEMRRRMLIEIVAIDLEYRWRQASLCDAKGEQAWTIEEYVKAFAQIGPLTAVPLTLIVEEYRVRRRWGDPPGHDEYLDRFPGQHAELTTALRRVDLELAGEQESTGDIEQTLDHETQHDEQQARGSTLRVRCPSCQDLVETKHGGSFKDVTCQSCGSSFSLVDVNPATSTEIVHETFAHFDLVQRLGQGAFGEVWKARDRKLDRTVAVKIPRKGQLDEQEAEKFLREARAAAQLKHPNIVGIHEVGREQGTLYIVSDLVRGMTLADWLTDQRPTQRRAAELCAKVAQALHHAHQAGVVHRDLKPGNIMLDEHDEPHVLDFGLAKRDAGEVTMTVEGQILGTPAYMSPEQARGEAYDVDRRADIYSLGVILFELLTGELPFRGNMRMMIHQVINDEAPSPVKLNNTLNRDLETICLKCLEKDPDKRYTTAQEVGEELTRFLDHEPIQARPISSASRGWRWCRRNPVVAALSASFMLLLVTGITVATSLAILAQNNEADAVAGWAAEEQQRRKAEANATALGESNTKVKQQRDRVIAANEETQAALARANYFLATARADGGRVMEAMEFLERVPEKLRQFHVRLAHHNFPVWDLTCYGHAFPVKSVAFSPDGGRLASCDERGIIKLWDAASGEEVRTLTGLRGHRGGLRFSPDGTQLASAGVTIKLWDASSGKELKTLPGHGKYFVNDTCFSPDGKRLASGSYDKIIKLWDLETGEELRTLKGHDSSVGSVEFSPDGARLASADNSRTFKLWDANTGDELKSAKNAGISVGFSPDGSIVISGGKRWDASTGKEVTSKRRVQPNSPFPASGTFSPDGMTLAGSVDRDGDVMLWDARTGEVLRKLTGHSSFVFAVAFSPDGRRLATAGDDTTIKVWDLGAVVESTNLVRHPRTITAHKVVLETAFSPDGTQLASCGTGGDIKLWDTNTADLIKTLAGHASDVRSVTYSPDGTWLASGSVDKTIRIWDVSTGKALRTLAGHDSDVMRLRFSPDGAWLASASKDKTIKLWEPSTGNELKTLKGHEADLISIAFHPDGRRLVSTARDATVRLWDIVTGEELMQLKGRERAIRITPSPAGVTFSPDGAKLAVTFSDEAIRLWDINTGEQIGICEGDKKVVYDVAFSPDGKTLASASGDNARLWDVNTGNELLTLEAPGTVVFSVAFSPDGTRLATGNYDGTVKLWDAPRPETRTLIGHRRDVRVVSFSPDCTKLASGSDDKTIKLWDLNTGAELTTLSGHQDAIRVVAFSPDGQRIVSASDDQTIKLWDATTGALLKSLRREAVAARVNFSPDGTEIYALEPGSAVLTWNIVTDQQESKIPEGRLGLLEPISHRSADGRWRAFLSREDVLLVDTQFKHTPVEKARREWMSKSDPDWHSHKAEQAERQNDWYAATFHRARAAIASPESDTAHDVRLWIAHTQLAQSQPQATELLPDVIKQAVSGIQQKWSENLLKNGSFEQQTDGEPDDWSLRSWRRNQKAASLDSMSPRSGRLDVQLRSAAADDVGLYQKVKVKPQTRYLFSGWLRAEDVNAQNDKVGATLSIWGGYERSSSVTGTSDWSFVSMTFSSGDRQEVEVGARLGHHGSTATGTVWFDDIALMELEAVERKP